jgi:hypothetical protein
MIHVFDMTDGTADYRLEFDAEALTWTLVAISDISETAKGLDYAKLAAANQ